MSQSEKPSLPRLVPEHPRSERALRARRDRLPGARRRLLEVVHDMDELRKTSAGRSGRRLFQERGHVNELALRLGRLGQEGVGAARTSTTRTSFRCTRAHEPLLGRALRQAARARGPLDQAVRQHAHRVLQGPRHDRARLDGEGDDRAREGKSIPAVACASTGDTSAALSAYAAAAGDSRGRLPAPGQGLDRPADPARGQRRHRLRTRHRLRRLHGDREADLAARRDLPRQLDEQPAHRRARRPSASRSSSSSTGRCPTGS